MASSGRRRTMRNRGEELPHRSPARTCASSAGVGLLYGILGFGQGAQEPAGEADQRAPLVHDRAQARVGLRVVWSRRGGHRVAGSLDCICLSPVRQDSAPECEAGAGRLTFSAVALSYCSDTIQCAGRSPGMSEMSVPCGTLISDIPGLLPAHWMVSEM